MCLPTKYLNVLVGFITESTVVKGKATRVKYCV